MGSHCIELNSFITVPHTNITEATMMSVAGFTEALVELSKLTPWI